MATKTEFASQLTTPTPCRRRPELFHTPDDGPGQRGTPAADRIEAAKLHCLECPLMIACRDWARANHETGIWGGEDDDERAAAGYMPQLHSVTFRPPCGTERGATWHRRHGERICEPCREAALFAHRKRARRHMTWPPNLNEREMNVLQGIAAGHDRGLIAAQLGIKRKLVDRYVSTIAKKLRTKTTDVVPVARRLGVITEEHAVHTPTLSPTRTAA
ncbi:WhiB family transcriptional regulator [Streptomyces albus]